jgi:UDP-N-acetylmuramate dehydrogenase
VFIAEVVERATVLTKALDVKEVGPEYFQFCYDYSSLRETGDIVLDVTFQLEPKPKEEIQRVMEENMAWRIAKQPQLEEFPSCGSVFKKIKGVGAGRLIDQAGLKGFRIGGAMVSPKHANYFVNVDHATAADVLVLIEHGQKVVKEKTGYWLEPEISIVGAR